MKFTSYKIWLNEKFTEESDPIKDMGIGEMNKKIDFKNEKELFKWIIDRLHVILKKESIPEDIIYCKIDFVKLRYRYKIEDYIDKYLTINNNNVWVDIEKLYHKLRKMGFKEPKGYEYEAWLLKHKKREKKYYQ